MSATEKDLLDADTNPDEPQKKKRGQRGPDKKPRSRSRKTVSVAEGAEGSLRFGAMLLAQRGYPCCAESVANNAKAIAGAVDELAKEYPGFAKWAERGRLMKWLALAIPVANIGGHVYQVHVQPGLAERRAAATAELLSFDYRCVNCGHELPGPHEQVPDLVCPSCGTDSMYVVEGTAARAS